MIMVRMLMEDPAHADSILSDWSVHACCAQINNVAGTDTGCQVLYVLCTPGCLQPLRALANTCDALLQSCMPM